MDLLPTADHWSLAIPEATAHPRSTVLEADGYVVLAPTPDPVPAPELAALRFVPWRSGGDTAFAPITSATGGLECDAFWHHGRADVDGRWTVNAERAPSLRRAVEASGARVGRSRVIQLQPQGRAAALANLHRDDNNRDNPEADGWIVRCWQELTDQPDSYLLLFDRAADGTPDPTTEHRVPLPLGTRVVVDSQRLWHAVVHVGPHPRLALITSVQSGPDLDAWMADGRRRTPAVR